MTENNLKNQQTESNQLYKEDYYDEMMVVTPKIWKGRNKCENRDQNRKRNSKTNKIIRKEKKNN